MSDDDLRVVAKEETQSFTCDKDQRENKEECGNVAFNFI